MNMKLEFENPLFEVISVGDCDVVTASNPTKPDGDIGVGLPPLM